MAHESTTASAGDTVFIPLFTQYEEVPLEVVKSDALKVTVVIDGKRHTRKHGYYHIVTRRTARP